MKIIHLSDIHVGKSKNTKNFQIIVNWLIDHRAEHEANVVIITGDAVDDGSLGQYREVRNQIDILEQAEFEVLVVPGNHDYGSNGIVEEDECVARFKEFICSKSYPYVKQIGDCSFVLLDSMLEEMKEYDLWGAQGKLGKAQLSELDRILDEQRNNNPDQKIVIALHHHPFYYNYFLELRDSDLFKKVIDKRINCLLFGHKHVENRFDDKQIQYGIDIIYASGSSTERDENGHLSIPVIDLFTAFINRILI
jgi:3',5'-cyclic AMP phosphodiesterase CpdA